MNQLSAFASLSGHPLVYLDHAQMSCSQKYHPHVDLCLTSLGVKHPGYETLFCKNRLIYQTTLFCTQDEENAYRERFCELKFVRWRPFSMDVLPGGGSKAEGVAKLAARTGFTPENVYAFRDNFNDMEMFRYAGFSTAMSNASYSLQLANHRE